MPKQAPMEGFTAASLKIPRTLSLPNSRCELSLPKSLIFHIWWRIVLIGLVIPLAL